MKRTKLKVLRVKHDLTQTDIAKRVGVTTGYYCDIENGKRDGGNKFWNTLKDEFGLTLREVYEIRENVEI